MSATTLQATQWLERDGTRIARGLRRHDPDMIERLIEQYQHRLFRYLVYLTGRRDFAEDVFQETWVRVLERGHQYNGQTRFETWLFAIARHLVIDCSRKKSAMSLEALTEPRFGVMPMEFASSTPSPFAFANQQQEGERIGAAMLQMEMAQREVLLLRFREELSLDEIAAVTGAPLSTVKSRLYRGLQVLRPLLEEKEKTQATAKEVRA